MYALIARGLAGFVLGVSIMVGLAATPAYADGTSLECDIQGHCHVVATKSRGGGGGKAESSDGCSWKGRDVSCEQGSGKFDAKTGCYAGAPPPGATPAGPVLAEYRKYGGSIVFATCPYGGVGGYLWQPPAKPVVTPELVREEALRLIPSAAIGVAPKNTTLVNIETVLWADAPKTHPLEPVTLLDQRVVINLSLDYVSWDFGDGETDSHAPAGKAYDKTNDPCRERTCSDYYGHVYVRTGKVEVTATAYWHATFTVDGGAVQDAGDVPGPQAAANITVKQARGVLVPNPGETP